MAAAFRSLPWQDVQGLFCTQMPPTSALSVLGSNLTTHRTRSSSSQFHNPKSLSSLRHQIKTLGGHSLILQYMAENGEEKLLAMARHISKTLGHDNNMADDILQIFSNFDSRFSCEKLASDDKRTRSCALLELSLKSLDRQISQYLTTDHPIWFDSADSAAFLDSIDELIATIRDWTPMADDKSVSVYLAGAEELIQQAMFRLEDEFRSLVERGAKSRELTQAFRGESNGALSFDSRDDDEEEEEEVIGDGEEHEIPMAQPIGDYDIVIDALLFGTINDLHEIAKQMVAASFGKECSHVYSSCRREFLEESLSKLGMQKLSIEEVQKTPWQDRVMLCFV